MAIPILCLSFFGCVLWVVLLKLENHQLKTDLDRVTRRLKANLKQMTGDVSLEGGSAMTQGAVGQTDRRIHTGHRV